MGALNKSEASQPTRRCGFTTVEVLVATLLASLLMVALIGVLAGLRAQAKAAQLRSPLPAWQRTLDGVLQADLENSRSFQLNGRALVLTGFAGRDAHSKVGTWLPTTVAYEVVESETTSWLIRRETPLGDRGLAATEQRELVLNNVTSVRVQDQPIDGALSAPASVVTTQGQMPIRNGLSIEFWGVRDGEASEAGRPSEEREVRYAYRFRKP